MTHKTDINSVTSLDGQFHMYFQNTVFVFKYILPHCILYLFKKKKFHTVFFYFKYILMYLCPYLLSSVIAKNIDTLGMCLGLKQLFHQTLLL